MLMRVSMLTRSRSMAVGEVLMRVGMRLRAGSEIIDKLDTHFIEFEWRRTKLIIVCKNGFR